MTECTKPVEFRRTKAKVKNVDDNSYDILEILLSRRVPSGPTINGKYYRKYIKNAYMYDRLFIKTDLSC